MACIEKRRDKYRIKVSNGFDITGKRITENSPWKPIPTGLGKKALEVELNGEAADFERKIRSGANIQGSRLTLKELSEFYLDEVKPPVLARTTYKDYSDRLKNRILPAMGHIKICDLRAKDLKDYRNMLIETYVSKKGTPLADSSIKKDTIVVSAMLSYAVSEGWLPMNTLIYTGKITKRRQKTSAPAVKYFTVDQLIRFIDALERPLEVEYKGHPTTVNGKKYRPTPKPNVSVQNGSCISILPSSPATEGARTSP